MVLRNLGRRRVRTSLTLLGIGVSVAAIVALGGLAQGMTGAFTAMMKDSQTHLLAAEADIDSDFSAIDERVAARIVARPDVAVVSGMIMKAAQAGTAS
jgi:putative ABC transport system permease protein